MHPHDLQRLNGNIQLLKVFHYVYAGLSALGLGFIVIHYMIMKEAMNLSLMVPPAASSPASGTVPPVSTPPPAMPAADLERLMDMMIWFYVVMGALILLVVILNILSAVFMHQRKHKMFSCVVAGLNCLNIPLGTILGIFTLIALMKPAADALYGDHALPPLPE